MVKFGARVRTGDSLPMPNFVKIAQGDASLRSKLKKSIVCDFELHLSPHFYWLKRTDLGNIRNPSTTQNFVRFAQGIAWPAGIALPWWWCILISSYKCGHICEGHFVPMTTTVCFSLMPYSCVPGRTRQMVLVWKSCNGHLALRHTQSPVVRWIRAATLYDRARLWWACVDHHWFCSRFSAAAAAAVAVAASYAVVDELCYISTQFGPAAFALLF